MVHFMLREGQEDVTLRYLATSPRRKLAINNFTEGASTPKLVDRRNKWMSRTSPVVSDGQHTSNVTYCEKLYLNP